MGKQHQQAATTIFIVYERLEKIATLEFQGHTRLAEIATQTFYETDN